MTTLLTLILISLVIIIVLLAARPSQRWFALTLAGILAVVFFLTLWIVPFIALGIHWVLTTPPAAIATILVFGIIGICFLFGDKEFNPVLCGRKITPVHLILAGVAIILIFCSAGLLSALWM